MTTYISILRGINVSGQKLIKMEALKKMYKSLGFEQIKTYIQSGNVIFSAKETSLQEMASGIATAIKKEFGFDVPVLVMDVATLQNIIEGNPLVSDEGKDPAFMHVTFLAEVPVAYKKEEIIAKKAVKEALAFANNVIYLYCPEGYGKTKLTNHFLEKVLEVTATTCNWKTANVLLDLAGA